MTLNYRIAAMLTAAVIASSTTGLEAKIPTPFEDVGKGAIELDLYQNNRKQALQLSLEGYRFLKEGNYPEAQKNLSKSIELYSRAKRPGGDLPYAEVAYRLGVLHYGIGEFNLKDRNEYPKSFKTAIDYFNISMQELELYLQNNQQFKNNSQMKRTLVMINSLLANSHRLVQNFRETLKYGLNIIELEPSDYHIRNFIDLTTEIPESELDELLTKIRKVLDPKIADELIEKIKHSREAPPSQQKGR